MRAIIRLLLSFLGTTMLLFGASFISADTAQYFYDPLGRLIGVMDGQGNLATYQYDAVGNLLSISRGPLSPPSIGAISPSIVDAGLPVPVTITGAGLSLATVTIANPDASLTGLTLSNTTITGILTVRNPTSFGQTSVMVKTPGGTASFPLTVRQPTPTISQISPVGGPEGTLVVIQGAGFATKPNVNRVTFSGAGNTRIQTPVLSESFTRLTARAPAGVRIGPVIAEVGAVSSNGVTFSIPGIQAILATALRGTPATGGVPSVNIGQPIQLQGFGFIASPRVDVPIISDSGLSGTGSAGVSNVSLDGTTASTVPFAGSTTGPWKLTGSALDGVLLQIVPTISSLPAQSLITGATVTIDGSGFKQGQTTVLFPGVPAPAPTTTISNNSSRLTVVIPAGVTDGILAIRTDGGMSNGIGIPFLQSLTATATTGTPATSNLASANGGQTIQLQGRGFNQLTQLLFSTTNEAGVPETLFVSLNFISPDGTTAIVAIPNSATTGPLAISGVGTVSLQIVPRVTSYSFPSSAGFVPGGTLKVIGSGFKQGATHVLFSGVATPVPTTSVTDGNTSATVTIPPGANGASFVVITDGGTSATRQFGLLQSIAAVAPRGTPQNPAQPSANVGQSIALQGVGFGLGDQAIFMSTSDTGTTGFVAAPLFNINPAGTSATVIVPATATSGPVSVDGQGNVPLQIVPTIFTLTLPAGQVFGPGVVATLGGTGFKEGATTVTFAGATPVAASDVTNGNSRLTVTIPPGAVAGTITVTADGNIGVFDTTRPSVKQVLPFNGQQNAALNTRIAVLFDEPVQPATVTTSSLFVNGPNGLVLGTVSLSSDQQTAILTPSQPLDVTNGYAVSFSPTIADLAGNALNPGTTTFSTGTASDTTAPSVTSVSPQSGTSVVPTNAVVRIYFSEALLNTSVTPQSVTLSAGDVPVSSTMFLEQNNTVLRLQPSAPLQANNTYTVTVSPTVTDLSGNSFGSQFVSTFSTGAGADTTAPTVSTRAPIDGAANVASDTSIDVTFSEPIETATVDATTTFTLTGGGISGTIPGMFSLTPDRLRVTFAPLFPLFAGQTFFLTLNGIEDSSGN